MNKNIKIGDRVVGEHIKGTFVVKIYGTFDGFNSGSGLARIITSFEPVNQYSFVVPSSLRKLVKKKKPYDNFLTSKGFEFQRTARGWIDETSRLEWMNEFKVGINHYDSEIWAQEQKMRLATQEDFIEAESHGIRELPGMMWKGYWFWASTQVSGYDGRVAYVFNGYNGSADDFYNREYSYSNVAARAVRKV